MNLPPRSLLPIVLIGSLLSTGGDAWCSATNRVPPSLLPRSSCRCSTDGGVAFLPTTRRRGVQLHTQHHLPHSNAVMLFAKNEDDDEPFEEEFLEYEEEEYDEDEEEEWDDDEDFQFYELQDDPSDPNYMKQKEVMEASVKARQQQKRDEHFDALDYIMDKMTDEQAQLIDQTALQKEIEERTQNMELVDGDVAGMDIESKMKQVSDLMDDPYPPYAEGEENLLQDDVGITNQDMINLQQAWNIAQDAQTREPWDKVTAKDETPGIWDSLDNTTLEEMDACLEELGGSAYNVTRWLLYDLDFNVTNLMLAAIQHNRKAPILLQHWYPQLLTYSRYKSAQDCNFDFTWQDVENANLSELERYYRGMGYDEIPTKAPGETGIISLEDLDEEEIRMVAFENWVADVYNPEWDRKDFDDDEMRDEDNVFSDYYVSPQHPDHPTYEEAQEDLAEWDEEIGDDEEDAEYKQFMGREYKYKVVVDEEFDREFRGHLVVACTGRDEDLEIAEKITARMGQEYGKQVFVETRVMAHAREEDNVFEVWLESYEIDLLHSKRRASLNVKGWDGPMECDDKQVEWLVGKVGFLISDDSRYSYRYEFETVE